MTSIPFITEHQMKSVCNVTEVIGTVERVLAVYSEHDNKPTGVVQPLRTVVPVRPFNGNLITMPAFSGDSLGCKLIALYPDQQPSHKGIVILFDATNGDPKALFDAEFITSIRTGAASAVASKYLAPDGSRVLALVGAGVQARSHYRCLAAIFHFDQVRIWSRTKLSSEKLANELRAIASKTEFVVTNSVKECVRNADIVCTVTHATEPLLDADWLKSDAHVNSVGAPRPHLRELHDNVVERCDLYADSRESAVNEAGDVIQVAGANVLAEIGQVIRGVVTTDRRRLTVFKSLGMALEDVVTAKLFFEKLSVASASL